MFAGCLFSVRAAQALDVLVAGPGEVIAADSVLSAPASADSQLVGSFRLRGVFDQAQRLGEGIPAKVILVVDLWRERSGWWDTLVASQTFTYRFQREMWSGAYEITDVDRSTLSVANRDSVAVYLERVHEVALGPGSRYAAGKRHYLTVKALVQPMDLEDLEAVDAWLSGRVTGKGGGVFGLPKGLAQWVVDMSGLGDQTAVGRSRPFVPRPDP